MNEPERMIYCRKIRSRLDVLLQARYGRHGGQGPTTRLGLTQLEAGYGTMGAPWALGGILATLNTDFQREQRQARMDVLMADLLQHPEDVVGVTWARWYGYSSPAALGRAFREWYGVGVGDARRIGTVGRWLTLVIREPRTHRGRSRQDEARLRILAFHRVLLGRPGSQARAALGALGSRTPDSSGALRPRYPSVGSRERERLVLEPRR